MKIGTVVTIGALFMSMSAGTPCSAAGLSLPGIPASGSPYFSNDVTLQSSSLAAGGYKLTASDRLGGDFVFHIGGQAYNVIGGNYDLTAYFDSSGTLDTVGSYVTVSGSFDHAALDALKSTTNPDYFYLLNAGNLFTARLDSFAFDLDSGAASLLGFKTTDFVGWAAQFGTTESVYLSGFNPDPSNIFAFAASLGSGTLEAVATTTVPIPSAIWLLGSSLLGYIVVGRRSARWEPSLA